MTIYLYVKQCKHCELKYFGVTTCDNPEKYKGSGSHWSNHLNKHFKSRYTKDRVQTLEIYKFESQDEATNFALEFSESNKIVQSKLWANEKIEDALIGNGQPRKPKKSGFSSSLKGRKYSQTHCENISKGMQKKNSGKTRTDEHKKAQSIRQIGKKHPPRSVESKKKMSLIMKGKTPWNKGKKTPRGSDPRCSCIICKKEVGIRHLTIHYNKSHLSL